MKMVAPSSVLASPMIGVWNSAGVGLVPTPGVGLVPTPARTAVQGGMKVCRFCGLGGHWSRPRNATSRAAAGGRSGCSGSRGAGGCD